MKYWCIDRFHARADGDTCTCSPLVHRRLDLRLRNVNSSIAEQTFSWFRGYASTFNVKNPLTHVFYVLLYIKKHNLLIRKDYLRHLNPFSARAKAAKNARVLIRPASKKYICRRSVCIFVVPQSLEEAVEESHQASHEEEVRRA